MRAVILAALISLASTAAAFADTSVAGHWRATMHGNVSIDMRVSPDGKWSSETKQGRSVLRKLSGTYTQTPPSGSSPGQLVFTPTSAPASNEKGDVETDTYTLGSHGKVLRLTSEGDTMVFHKQSR